MGTKKLKALFGYENGENYNFYNFIYQLVSLFVRTYPRTSEVAFHPESREKVKERFKIEIHSPEYRRVKDHQKYLT